jgi:hypothetical protein
MTGLVRYFVLFVIDLRSRRVEIAGIAHQLSSGWMAQMARNLADAGDGFRRNMRYLVHDRDPMFTQQFVEILENYVNSLSLLRRPEAPLKRVSKEHPLEAMNASVVLKLSATPSRAVENTSLRTIASRCASRIPICVSALVCLRLADERVESIEW